MFIFTTNQSGFYKYGSLGAQYVYIQLELLRHHGMFNVWDNYANYCDE